MDATSTARDITATAKDATAKGANLFKSSNSDVVHDGILCDGCNQKIQGVRYKCLECYDFDLCEACEFADVENLRHSHNHQLLKIKRNERPVISSATTFFDRPSYQPNPIAMKFDGVPPAVIEELAELGLDQGQRLNDLKLKACQLESVLSLLDDTKLDEDDKIALVCELIEEYKQQQALNEQKAYQEELERKRDMELEKLRQDQVERQRQEELERLERQRAEELDRLERQRQEELAALEKQRLDQLAQFEAMKKEHEEQLQQV
ncbi:unnamed protein product [Ambrosiozyma monospora]|uniref:Unnamed protein product n=1 Tax=Ambrosiozyma monospora TaxID=43982 RepID=A0ACB5TY04_AMBMO|nr:unnamed protein product [Ambrosiozyma monospora]